MSDDTTTANQDSTPYEGIPGPTEGGVGFTQFYTGPSGTVPVGANPDDGELFFGKRTEFVWIEITHEVD